MKVSEVNKIMEEYNPDVDPIEEYDCPIPVTNIVLCDVEQKDSWNGEFIINGVVMKCGIKDFIPKKSFQTLYILQTKNPRVIKGASATLEEALEKQKIMKN